VNLIYKKDIPFLQIREYADKIACPLNRRARGSGNLGVHLMGNNMRKGGLA
jgi:hypothetical protein